MNISKNSPAKPETQSKNKPWRVQGIRIRPLRLKSGTTAYRVEVPERVSGKRILKQFKTPDEAESYAAVMVTERKNNGLNAFELTESQRADARNALEMLAKANCGDINLIQVTDFYLKHARPPAGDITVEELRHLYLDAKKRENLRPRSLSTISNRLGNFAKSYGSRLIKDIRADEIETWLFADKNRANQTRRTVRTVLNAFFNFAQKAKFVAENPIRTVTNPKVDDRTPDILTIPQVTALLHTSLHQTNLDLVTYVALGVFCGVRSDELAKLDWSAVDLEAGQITISQKIAKKRRIRIIRVPDCCKAWLMAGGLKTSGPIRPKSFAYRWEKLTTAANEFGGYNEQGQIIKTQKPLGLLPWPINALRHSAASYHFAKYGDAAKTCAMLGQKDDQVLFDHYRSLVKPADAERFYQILPPEPSNKIIPFPAQAIA